jgi:crotonobetainyl-CoA:carnitine CoA-transferase CaiB-like acyl-CoA transferase
LHSADGCYPDSEPGERPYNRHGYFNERNRNRLGLCLDLRDKGGRAAFLRLVTVSDVLVENFAAGTMDRLGLSYNVMRTARPELIMASMPSFGSTGPERDYVGYGATNDQLSGLVSVTGYEGEGPQNIGINASDPLAGQHAAGAVLTALVERQRTGRGQLIDLSHRESAARLMAGPLLDYQMNGRVAGPRGNRHSYASPQGVYACDGEDEWVAIAVESDDDWARLCSLMERPKLARDTRFADVVSRWHNRGDVDEVVGAWTRERMAEEVMRTLQDAGIAAGMCHTAETFFADAHLRARGFFERIVHPEAGSHEYLGIAWRMSRTPGQVRMPAPCLGEHSERVLRDVAGLTAEEWEGLEAEGVSGVGYHPAD